jgi:hypothetical protein
MDLVSTAINSAVVAAVGLILAFLGRGKFEAHERRMDRMEERLDQRMNGLQASMDGMRSDFVQSLDGVRSDFAHSLDALRSDLSQVALAVGAKPRATNA